MNARQKAKYYKRKYEELSTAHVPVFAVEKYKIDLLRFERMYPGALIACGNEQAILDTVKRDLAFGIAEKLGEYVEYRTDYDEKYDKYRIMAQIRIARNRFGDD